MQVSGHHTFDHPQAAVWSILMNPDAIARSLPGVKEMRPHGDEPNAWRMITALTAPGLDSSYAGIVRLSDVVPPDSYHLAVIGEGVDGTANITLRYDEEKAQTLIEWSAEAHMAGQESAIAQKLLAALASTLVQQFFRSIGKQLKAR